jgi:hypothetical protein
MSAAIRSQDHRIGCWHLFLVKSASAGLSSPFRVPAVIRSQVLHGKADRFAANVRPIIHDLQAQGITSHKAIARALNARGIRTVNGRQRYGARR